MGREQNHQITPGPPIQRVAGVCGGEPVIAGTRITVNLIHQCFTRRFMNVNKILAEYPHLTKDQIMEALKYARVNPSCLKDEEDV
jgi:uncharacterized protein (DUF433 family)